MANIIIIHGTMGSPKGNWFPWLKSELEKLGHNVFVPKFPTPEGQNLDNWMKTFQDYKKYLDEDSILVGHSLGPSFILSILENLDRSIKSAYLVAGFTGLLDNKEFDTLNESFVTKSFNWSKIKQNCGSFYVINSDDDPYVPLEKGKDLADSLGTELIVLNNAGHINIDSGYNTFEFLLSKIKENQ